MKKDIAQRVAATFKKFPTVDTVYATADGNVFIDKNRAAEHAGNKGKYTAYLRKEEAPADETPKTVKELLAEIKEATTVEQLEKYTQDEHRKTVLEAVEKRTAELTKTEE